MSACFDQYTVRRKTRKEAIKYIRNNPDLKDELYEPRWCDNCKGYHIWFVGRKRDPAQ